MQASDFLRQDWEFNENLRNGQYAINDGVSRIPGGPELCDPDVVENLMRTRPNGIPLTSHFSLNTAILPGVARVLRVVSNGLIEACSDERVLFPQLTGIHTLCGAADMVAKNTHPQINADDYIEKQHTLDNSFPGYLIKNDIPDHSHVAYAK